MERTEEKDEACGMKIILDSIRRANEKGGCKQNCLGEVVEKYIFYQEYIA